MKRHELLIEPDELRQHLDSPSLRLFDASVLFQAPEKGTAYDAYRRAHLPGAAFFDHARVSDPSSSGMFTVPDEQTLARSLGDLGIGNDHLVVFYATNQMMWATRAWWLLRYAGHRNVRVLNGILETWPHETSDAETAYEPAVFETQLTPGMFVSAEEVLSAIGDGEVCTVNALPFELYTGATEVPYAKDGHITGSISHPFSELMDGHCLKQDDELKAIFADRMTGKRLITYCGGGVAATLNASAALLAGLEDVAVYDGSLSEWTARGLPLTAGESPG